MRGTPEHEAVIVATDGSVSALAAVRWAADEAVRYGRPLRIVHVQESWALTAFGLPSVPPAEIDQERSAVARNLLEEAAQLAADHRPGLVITTEHLHGHVVQALREASARGSEIVVGHRGLNRFAELLLGSTGLALAGHLETPVVVVRGEVASPRGEVVVGTDLGDEMGRPLKYAFEAARSRGASLRVLHAWDATAGVRAIVKGYTDPLDRLEEQLAPFRALFPEVKATEEMVYDNVLQALIEASSSADLLVVGSRGRGALTGTMLGSSGHGVLHHARCPVAVITPH